jgi:hypothetical protein
MSLEPRAFATPVTLITAIGAVLSLVAAGGLSPALDVTVRLLAWTQFMALPGLALYLHLQRSGRTAADTLLATLGVSPVILAGLACLSDVAGVPTPIFLGVVASATSVLLVTAARSQARPMVLPPWREAWAFVALLAAAIIFVAFLPATRDWWRVRSDAWFHEAVVLEMRDIGVPPQDPYFAGMPLQYMWAYHALVLSLGRALRLDYFWVMAVLNWHALALLAVASYRLAAVFRGTTAHRIAAVATTLFAFNAAFWIFLPVKAARALTGEIRGLDELSRTFALTPLNLRRSYDFLSILGSPPFLLDKYMVATAFGIAVALMLASLAAGCAYLSRRDRGALLVLGTSVAGTVLFHTYVGLVTALASLGAAVGLYAFRRVVRGYAIPMSVVPGVVVALAVVLTGPFIYIVTHIKDGGGSSLFGISPNRTLAILVPCALVMILAWRERRVRTDAAPEARFLQFFALLTFALCLVIGLPGANDTAKPPFLVFVSLAVVAGLAVADSCLARSGRARGAAIALWVLLFALPCNAIALAGCWGDPGETVVSADEHSVALWASANTTRRDVFIDDPERVFLLVAGPRRYLFGSWDYASQWKYPRGEMARRFHTVRNLFEAGPLDSVSLALLGSSPDPLFVIVRPEHRDAGAAVELRGDLFPVVFNDGDIHVRAVDRRACALAATEAAAGPSEEELVRDSGL